METKIQPILSPILSPKFLTAVPPISKIPKAYIGGTAVRNFGYVMGYMMVWIFCFHAIFLAKCNMSQSCMCKLAI